jgi:hypothetical protein
MYLVIILHFHELSVQEREIQRTCYRLVGNALFFPYHQFSGMKVSQRVSRDCLIVFELGKPLVQPTACQPKEQRQVCRSTVRTPSIKGIKSEIVEEK